MERGRGKSHGLQNLRLSGRSDHGHQATHGVPCQRQAVLRQVPLNLPNQGVCLLSKVELTFILLTLSVVEPPGQKNNGQAIIPPFSSGKLRKYRIGTTAQQQISGEAPNMAAMSLERGP